MLSSSDLIMDTVFVDTYSWNGDYSIDIYGIGFLCIGSGRYTGSCGWLFFKNIDFIVNAW